MTSPEVIFTICRRTTSDCFRRGETQSAQEFHFSFLLFNMEGNQTSLIESNDSEIKKLMASAVPESTKKSLKYAVDVFEVKKVTSRLLIFSST